MPEQSPTAPATPPAAAADTQAEVLTLLHAQNGLLLAIGEQLGLLLRLMQPAPNDGPSLEGMLAGLVEATQRQTEVLERLDGRTLALGVDLPPLIARAMLRAERDRDLYPDGKYPR